MLCLMTMVSQSEALLAQPPTLAQQELQLLHHSDWNPKHLVVMSSSKIFIRKECGNLWTVLICI